MLPWAAYDWRFRAAKSSIVVTARGSGTKGGLRTFAALRTSVGLQDKMIGLKACAAAKSDRRRDTLIRTASLPEV